MRINKKPLTLEDNEELMQGDKQKGVYTMDIWLTAQEIAEKYDINEQSLAVAVNDALIKAYYPHTLKPIDIAEKERKFNKIKELLEKDYPSNPDYCCLWEGDRHTFNIIGPLYPSKSTPARDDCYEFFYEIITDPFFDAYPIPIQWDEVCIIRKDWGNSQVREAIRGASFKQADVAELCKASTAPLDALPELPKKEKKATHPRQCRQ